MQRKARKLLPTSESETDLRALLLLSLDGDQKAYADFLEKVASMLRSYLKKSVGSGRVSSEQTEDLVQDVLLAIHQKRGTYRTDLPLEPWLFTIARYRLIDSYRAEGRKPLVTSFDEDLGGVDAIAAPESTSHTSSDRSDVDALLSTLTEKQRTILHLAKVDELPLAEVSTRMNMSLSAVKVTIHRALATLRRNQNSKTGGNHEDE